MTTVTVYVPHANGHLVGPTATAPWIAADLHEAAAAPRPSGERRGPPVFRSAAQAWAWVDWARRDGGLSIAPLAVAKVDALLIPALRSSSPQLHLPAGALADPAMQVPRHRRPPTAPAGMLAEAAAGAAARASRLWERAAASPGRHGRIGAAATLAWQAAYPIAYAHGYATVAYRAGERVRDLLERLAPTDAGRHAAEPLRRLIEVTEGAIPGRVLVPDPPGRVHEIAALAALAPRGGRTAPQAVTHDVHRYAVRLGGVHGAATAATDINAEWRSRIDPGLLVTRSGDPHLVERANAAFATVHREFITPWVAAHGDFGATVVDTAPAVARCSFAAAATTNSPAPPPPDAQPGNVVALRRRSRP